MAQDVDLNANQYANQNWAFALVHGIGTTQPMVLIEEVTAALKTVRPGVELVGPIEAHKVIEKSDPATLGTEPSDRRQYVQRAKIPNGTARFAATHWSDISFYKDGLINMIGGLMLTSFGVRFFAQSAAAEGNWIARILDFVLKLMVWIIAFVTFPFTFVSLIYSLMGILAENLLKGSILHWQSWFIIIMGLGLSCLTVYIGLKKSLPMQSERPLAVPLFCCMLAYAVLIALLFLGSHFDSFVGLQLHRQPNITDGPEHISPNRHGPIAVALADVMQWTGLLAGHKWWVLRVESLDRLGIYFAFFHWFQTVAGAILIVLSISSLLLVAIDFGIAKWRKRRGQDLVFATVAVISIWIANLVVLWPENLVTASAMSAFSRDWKSSEGTDFCKNKEAGTSRARICGQLPADFLETLTVFNWDTFKFTNIKPHANDLVDDKVMSAAERAGLIEKASTPRVDSFGRTDSGLDIRSNINGYYPVMWFEGAFIAFMILMGIFGLFVVIARKIWTAWASGCDLTTFEVKDGEQKALRVSWPRLIVADIYMGSVFVLMSIVGLIFFAHSPLAGDLEERLARGFFASDVTVLPHELPIPYPWMKVGVFTFVVLSALAATYIRDITKLILDVVNHFAAPKKGFPVRRRIEERFHQTIDFLLAEGDKPHLVVIAHSQGTVITFDALRDGLWDSVKDRVQSLTIVTFGSPITHVYQHYFARLYPALSIFPQLRKLRHEKRFKWVNVYRVDDFVGTYVENSIPCFPVNVPLPPGGHTAYWQQDAFEALFTHAEMKTVLPTAVHAAAPSYVAPV